MPVQGLTREQLQERAQYALEWKQFRRNYLFTQAKLAEVLDCNRRTVTNVESCVTVRPHPDLLRGFVT